MGGIILAYRYKIEIEVDEKKIKTENNFTFDEVCEKFALFLQNRE